MKKLIETIKTFTVENSILVYLALVKLTLHLIANILGGYGIFRDEFYYIACSEHMDWGYVDQPPLSIALLWINKLFFGDSLFAVRLLPAIAGAITVFLAGLTTKELGGKKFAQVLAACSVIAAPLTIATNSYFSMNSFDLLFWTLAFYLIILIVKNDDPKYWIYLGVVLGLGLMNKISVLWLGAGFAAGLLLTPNRKLLLTQKVWIGAVTAFIIFLPHIIWQIFYGFPTLEFIKNAITNKYSAVSPLQMFIEQVLNMNPLTILIWMPALVYFLVSKQMKQYRILPIIYIAVFIILVINKNSKSEYMGPMFPMLFALGSFAAEKFIARYNWRWFKPVFITLLIFSGIAFTPFAMAVLPVETYISYARAFGKAPSTSEKKEIGKLPQHYADMHGWDKMAATVAEVYNTLTPEEKSKCAIICNNYGEAGAIDYYGSRYGLPKAISGHNNYWIWGPGNATGEVVIRLGGSKEAMLGLYKKVKQTGLFSNEYCMPYENNMPVYICKARISPLKDDWANFRHYE